MNNINKNNIQTILLLIIVGFVVYNFYYSTQIKTNVDEYKNKIETIGVEIDSLNNLNTLLDDKLNIVNTNIVSINTEIESVDDSLKKLKKKTDEKVDSVDDYSFNELEQFFAERYGKE